ncbi:CHASE3 domain-containing protein [Magnetococcales bacterium HHB-1]
MMGFNAKLVIGTVFIFIMILINGYLMHSTIQSLLSTLHWVDHTAQVINQGEKLIKLLVDMETGARGYLIVGRKTFLEPYDYAGDTFWSEWDKTDDLVRDNPQQIRRLGKVKLLAERWRQEVAQPLIEKRRRTLSYDQNVDKLQARLSYGLGRKIFEKMQRKFAVLEQRMKKASVGHEAHWLLLAMAKDMAEQSAGQRGFLLTGDEGFLEQFEQSRANFQEHYQQLSGRLQKRSSLMIQLRLLEKLAAQWIKTVGRTEISRWAKIHEQKRFLKEIVAVVEAETGKKIMDHLRHLLHEFIQVERMLMEQRKQRAQTETAQAMQLLILGIVAIIFFGSMVTFIVLRLINRPLNAITKQMESLGEGEIHETKINYRAHDHLGRMLKAVSVVLANMTRLTRQVNQISKGDYSERVKLLSNKDILGEAINQMTDTLEQNHTRNHQQNWISTGLRLLSYEMSGNLEVKPLAERALTFLTRYLEAGRSVFYARLDLEQDTLECVAHCMVMESDASLLPILPGEGAVGQVFQEKKPLLLTNIPEETQTIATGTVIAAPRTVYIFPLIYKEHIQGVVELASFNPFEAHHQTLLKEAADLIAVGLFTARQQQKIHQLLRLAQNGQESTFSEKTDE